MTENKKKELQKRIKTLQIFLLYDRNAKYNITMSPTIIDTKELHYNSYYKGLEANKIHKITSITILK